MRAVSDHAANGNLGRISETSSMDGVFGNALGSFLGVWTLIMGSYVNFVGRMGGSFRDFV